MVDATNARGHVERLAELLGKVSGTFKARCAIKVSELPDAAWTIDFGSKPPVVVDGDARTDCVVEMTEAQIIASTATKFEGDQAQKFVETLKTAGPPEVLTVLGYLFLDAHEARGSMNAWVYDDTARLMPDPQLTFMNMGYAKLDGDDDFGWLKPEDALWKYSINLVRHLVKDIDLVGKLVVDVGSGRGGTASYLARYHGVRSAFGMDFCREAVALSTRSVVLPNVRYVIGDAQALPFATGSVDVVTNIESSHCYPSLRTFLKEVVRVLRPGGTFAYTDNYFQGTDFFLGLFDEVGLKVERHEDIHKNVARATRLNRGQLESYFRSLKGADADRDRFIDEHLGTFDYDKLDDTPGYYHLWRLVRT